MDAGNMKEFNIAWLKKPRCFKPIKTLRELTAGTYYRVVVTTMGDFLFQEKILRGKPYKYQPDWMKDIDPKWVIASQNPPGHEYTSDLGVTRQSGYVVLVRANSKNLRYIELLRDLGPVGATLALSGRFCMSRAEAVALVADWRFELEDFQRSMDMLDAEIESFSYDD